MTDRVHLGFEVGTGEEVSVPMHHAIVSGVTGLSGKTTAISAMLSRLPDGYRSLVFSTKRGEISFEGAHEAQPFYKATVDWEYVSGVLEAARKERLKFERSWIIKASRGASSLRDVYQNIVVVLEDGKPLRGLDESVWTVLRAYFEKVLPELESQPWAASLDLVQGVNVMRLEHLSEEVQGLVIAASLEEAHRAMANVVLVIPEAWAYVPQQRGSPVKWAAQHIIRQGRARGIYLFLDSQDVTSIDKGVLKSVDLWILGRQREFNEVRRILDQLPATQKPKPSDVMTLGVGRFYVAAEDWLKLVYVQPQWLGQDQARQVALGAIPVVGSPAPAQVVEEEDRMLIADLREQLAAVQAGFQDMRLEREMEQAYRQDVQKQLATVEAERNSAQQELIRIDQALNDASHKALEMTQGWEKATRQVELLNAEVDGARRLRQALRQLLGTSPTLERAEGPETMDEEEIVEKVLARLGAWRPVIQVVPLEALKHRFQQEAVARLTLQVQALEERPRQAILWLLAVGRPTTYKEICSQLGFPEVGVSYSKFRADMKEAVDIGLLTSDSHGLHVAVRNRVAAELWPYSPAPEDIEATYQHLLTALAGVAGVGE